MPLAGPDGKLYREYSRKEIRQKREGRLFKQVADGLAFVDAVDGLAK